MEQTQLSRVLQTEATEALDQWYESVRKAHLQPVISQANRELILIEIFQKSRVLAHRGVRSSACLLQTADLPLNLFAGLHGKTLGTVCRFQRQE